MIRYYTGTTVQNLDKNASNGVIEHADQGSFTQSHF